MVDLVRASDGCFVLIKQKGHSAAGAALSARDCALALLKARMWALWTRTQNSLHIKQGSEVAIYLAGSGPYTQHFVGKAKVAEVRPWSRTDEQHYPLVLDGTPARLLLLEDIEVFDLPVSIKPLLPYLRFLPPNRAKWGVAFMGGMRSVSRRDFRLLTSGLPSGSNANA